MQSMFLDVSVYMIESKMGIQMLIGDPFAKWYISILFHSWIGMDLCEDVVRFCIAFSLGHVWAKFRIFGAQVFAPRQTYQEELPIGHAWAHGAGALDDG